MLEAFLRYLENTSFHSFTLGNLVMFAVAGALLYIAVVKNSEPLLLVPISFGIILANIPPDVTGILNPPRDGLQGGLLWYLQRGLYTGVYPPLIFLGIGALTDFSFMLSYPITIFLGAAAQAGIFITFLLSKAIGFNLKQAASIAIIGGADGPTSIYTASRFAPELLSVIAVAAYSYIALIPVLQPIVSKALTTKEERMIRMGEPRHVSKLERVLFPIIITLIVGALVPKALPLVGMLMFGNLLREVGVVKRLVEAASRFILDTVTILLMVSVGSTARADLFLRPQSLMIFGLGAFAFITALATGILFAKFMNLFLKNKVNPLIGAAGVSAVPDSARVAQKIAMEEDPHNYILMHAMGPNVAGVIGSAIAAGVFLSLLR